MLQKLFPSDIPLMVLFQADAPSGHGHRLHALANFTFGTDLPPILITTKDIHPRIRWIPEHAEHTPVRQPPPNDAAVPSSTISAFRKAQPTLCELMHHSVGTARFAKQAEHQGHCASYFFIGIEDDTPLVVVAETDGEWKSQLTFFCFVELTAEEARA